MNAVHFRIFYFPPFSFLCLLLVCRALKYYKDLWFYGFILQPFQLLLLFYFLFWFVCVCRYLKVPMGNMGVLDPTEIHNRGQLKSHMKEAMIKLGYHLLCFFIYLYRWEHLNTGNGLNLKLFCFLFYFLFCVMSHPPLFLQHDPGSDQRLKHTRPLSSPTHLAPSSCTLLPQTCLSNAIRSAVNLLRVLPPIPLFDPCEVWGFWNCPLLWFFVSILIQTQHSQTHYQVLR